MAGIHQEGNNPSPVQLGEWRESQVDRASFPMVPCGPKRAKQVKSYTGLGQYRGNSDNRVDRKPLSQD